MGEELRMEESGPTKANKTRRLDGVFNYKYQDPLCREIVLGARPIDLDRSLKFSDPARLSRSR